MFLRTAVILALAASLFAGTDDDRAADLAAIRAHIDSIYQAFIHKDRDKIRATHDDNWHGFLEGSRKMIHNIDEYMNYVGPLSPSPYGMTAYRVRDYDVRFQGDAAFVTFIAEVDLKLPGGVRHVTQRLADFYIKKDGAWMQAGSNTSISPETIEERMQQPAKLSEFDKKELLTAREAVWRAFFTNDRAALEKLLPEELVTIELSGDSFGNRAAVLEGSAQFAKSGTKLVKLDFPKTELQSYGDCVILYSTYVFELEKDGQRSTHSGRVTEVFVNRKGEWVNPGWHMDSVQ